MRIGPELVATQTQLGVVASTATTTPAMQAIEAASSQTLVVWPNGNFVSDQSPALSTKDSSNARFAVGRIDRKMMFCEAVRS